MGEVVDVDFKPPELEYCFQCGCGSQNFILLFGGCIQCEDCRYTVVTAVWIMLPPELKGK